MAAGRSGTERTNLMGEIEGVLTCKICGVSLRLSPTATADLLGSDVTHLTKEQLRTAGQLAEVARHLQQKHPRRNRVLDTQAAGFLGLLKVMEYRTNDRGIQEARDFARWSIVQLLLKVGPRITDQHIDVKSREFADHLVEMLECEMETCGTIREPFHPSARAMFQLKVAKVVGELVTTIRNQLEERDKYPTPEVTLN
jgi:hypothetical protein